MARTLNIESSIRKLAEALRHGAAKIRARAQADLDKADLDDELANHIESYRIVGARKKLRPHAERIVTSVVAGLTKAGTPDRRYKQHRSPGKRRKIKAGRKKRQ